MGTVNIDLTTGNKIQWPDKCAVCGAPASELAEASLTAAIALRYYVVALGWMDQTHSILYPVCNKHKFFCNLIDSPGRWGFISCFLFFIFVPTFVWICTILLIAVLFNIKGDDLFPISTLVAILSYGSTLFFFLYCALKKPLSVSKASETSITIKMRNQKFFKDFIKYNSGLLNNKVL